MTAIDEVTSEMSVPRTAGAQKALSVLVATDGTDASNAAFTAASLVAGRVDADFHVLSVLEPITMPAVVPHALLQPADIDTSRARDLAHRVRAQMKAMGSDTNGWRIETRIGLPAEEIARVAREHRANLIITGASHHGFLDRLIGEETAARVAQLARTPLLVASPNMHRLPQRVAIAIDLDPSYLASLPMVLSMFGPAASVMCVHVKRKEDFPGSDSPAFERAYESAVAQSFRATEDILSKAPGMRADLAQLNGDPAAELLRYAEYAKMELIVLGLRRHYGLRRLLGGGVALKVLRGASCSVLLVPEDIAPVVGAGIQQSEENGATQTFREPGMWAAELKQFTQRNAGRHAALEVAGPAIGALPQVTELPFIGADYDHRDGRVEILLGDFVGSDRHLTRSIPDPTSISLLKGQDGVDSVLCVTYGGGQTLLTFSP